MSQYATFELEGRTFGVNILLVREINRVMDITPVPEAPSCIRGLINLRGQIVTIFDLGLRLGLPARELTRKSHHIILKTDAELAPLRRLGLRLDTHADAAGLMVDAIGEVVEGDDTLIEPPSANVPETEARYLAGVLKTGTQLIALLNTQALLNLEATH